MSGELLRVRVPRLYDIEIKIVIMIAIATATATAKCMRVRARICRYSAAHRNHTGRAHRPWISAQIWQAGHACQKCRAHHH